MIPVERGWLALSILLAAGYLSTSFSLWVFRRFSKLQELRAAVNRVIAHLLEFRLFADEPVLILRAQRDLLIDNGRMLKSAAVPSLILLVPVACSFVILDGFFTHAPLPVGQAAVITRKDSLDTRLELPPQIRIETPPVRIVRLTEASWRIRPIAPTTGVVVAGTGLHWIRPQRSLIVTYPPARVFHQHWLVWYFLGAGLFACHRLFARLFRI